MYAITVIFLEAMTMQSTGTTITNLLTRVIKCHDAKQHASIGEYVGTFVTVDLQ